jgi:hypothetical protein
VAISFFYQCADSRQALSLAWPAEGLEVRIERIPTDPFLSATFDEEVAEQYQLPVPKMIDSVSQGKYWKQWQYDPTLSTLLIESAQDN